jgi:5-methylcytosine-specific restriction endonuclease McrA
MITTNKELVCAPAGLGRFYFTRSSLRSPPHNKSVRVYKMKLNVKEKKARKILIDVAMGKRETKFPRLITYKEFWELISKDKWGQGQQSKIVDVITKISAVDIEDSLPPLNEIVVLGKTQEPSESWSSIRKYIKSRSGTLPKFKSHKEAQQACWEYWSTTNNPTNTPLGVEEGIAQDKTVKFRSRNKVLVAERKALDKSACKACGYKMVVNGRDIIDVHHKYPLSDGEGVRVTSIEDLICLCPNCHRISHSKKFPLSVKEIKSELKRSLQTPAI